MNITRSYLLAQECNTSPSSIVQERAVTIGSQARPSMPPRSNAMMKLAIRISRSKWYVFIRRVFHYQNGSRSELGPNPFDSVNWIFAEFMTLAVQICFIVYTLVVSQGEKPVWPMRLWATGYAFGCFLGLGLQCRRYQLLHVDPSGGDLSMLEQQTSHDQMRKFQSIQRCKTSLELLFAIWFVMGNVWVFDTRLASSYNRAPRLHVLCISVLAWNAMSYSFPLVLFVLLCICVPLLSSLSGYNMNVGSEDKGATDEQINCLPKWNYKDIVSGGINDKSEECCCICLAKYKDREEIRQLLPCKHTFHLQCVDQWLKIASCCPLCKQGIL